MIECNVTKLYGRHVMVRAVPIEASGGIGFVQVTKKTRDERGNEREVQFDVVRWVIEGTSDEVAADHPDWAPGTTVVVSAHPKRFTQPNEYFDKTLVIVKEEDVIGLCTWEDKPVILGATDADVAATEASRIR